MLHMKQVFGQNAMRYESTLKSKFSGKPHFNETFINTGYGYGTQPTSYSDIRKYVKRSSEAMGIFMAIVTDTMSDGIKFVGKKKWVEMAEKFSKTHTFYENLEASMLDRLIYGDGYIWIGKTPENRVKEALAQLTKNGVEFKATPDEILSDNVDQFANNRFLQVPSYTMHIDFNETDIIGYRQIIANSSAGGPLEVKWNPDEVIHSKFFDFDGKVYGFSPAEVSLPEISTLILIKDYAGFFFDNGGIPDWMFILEEEQAGSANHERLVQALREMKDSRAKHGNMVFTGKVKPMELNKLNKDMEFRQLAIYYTGVLALAFNMPLSRIMSIIGAENSGGGSASSGTSEEGYWRRISKEQDYWERLLNTRFFQPWFNVDMKFNRSYKQDEVREAQIFMTKVDTLTKMRSSLNLPLKVDYVKRILNLRDEDLEEQGFLEVLPGKPETNRKQQLSQPQLLSEPAKLNRNEAKRAEQLTP